MLYQIAVFLHLLAAITWLGGALFLAMVMVPLTRREMESPGQAARLLGRAALRFRRVAWASIILLVLTGLYLGGDHFGISPAEFLGGESFFIKVLQMKTGLVLVIIVLSAIHDFVIGPRVMEQLERVDEQGGRPSEELQRARRRVGWLARVNVLLMLIVVALAVMLTRGSPF